MVEWMKLPSLGVWGVDERLIASSREYTELAKFLACFGDLKNNEKEEENEIRINDRIIIQLDYEKSMKERELLEISLIEESNDRSTEAAPIDRIELEENFQNILKNYEKMELMKEE